MGYQADFCTPKGLHPYREWTISAPSEISRSRGEKQIDLMAWIFFQDAYDTDILSEKSAAGSMNRMRQDYIFYKRAYEDNSTNPMWSHMREYFVARYTEIARKKLGTTTLDTQTQYSIRLYCYGTLGMTREWLLNDNITPAETVVRMMFNSMPQSLRIIYFS